MCGSICELCEPFDGFNVVGGALYSQESRSQEVLITLAPCACASRWNMLLPHVLPSTSRLLMAVPCARTRGAELVLPAEQLQLASALVLPLFAYKLAAMIQGNRLQWYLDATIALCAAALVVMASK